MFTGFTDATVDFLWGIRFNNERLWFEAHKETYLSELYRPMKDLGAEIYEFLSERRPDDPMVCRVSRIYRAPDGSTAGDPIRTTFGSAWNAPPRIGPPGRPSGLSWGRITGATVWAVGWPGPWTWPSCARGLSGTRSPWKS